MEDLLVKKMSKGLAMLVHGVATVGAASNIAPKGLERLIEGTTNTIREDDPETMELFDIGWEYLKTIDLTSDRNAH